MRHSQRYLDTPEGKEIIERVAFHRQRHNGDKPKSCEQIARLLNAEGHVTMEGKQFHHWLVRYLIQQTNKAV